MYMHSVTVSIKNNTNKRKCQGPFRKSLPPCWKSVLLLGSQTLNGFCRFHSCVLLLTLTLLETQVPLGQRSHAESQSGKQANFSVSGLLYLSLVPCHGAWVLWEPGDCWGPQQVLCQHQGRQGGEAGCGSSVHDVCAGTWLVWVWTLYCIYNGIEICHEFLTADSSSSSLK